MKPLWIGLVALASLWLWSGIQAAQTDKDKLELSDPEQQILKLTNEERAKQKLPPLTANATLFTIARAHTANMAKQAKLDHDLGGKDPLQRIKEGGYNYSWGGENIAYGSKDVAAVMKNWMSSKFHRENILESKFSEIGIGAVKGKDGNIYYTQVFGAPLVKK